MTNLSVRPTAENRLRGFMTHSTRYSSKGRKRLVEDAKVSTASVKQLLAGKNANPSFVLVCRIVGALERAFGRRFDPREVVCENGVYLSPSLCSLLGCPGCLPENAFDGHNELRPEFRQEDSGFEPIPELSDRDLEAEGA